MSGERLLVRSDDRRLLAAVASFGALPVAAPDAATDATVLLDLRGGAVEGLTAWVASAARVVVVVDDLAAADAAIAAGAVDYYCGDERLEGLALRVRVARAASVAARRSQRLRRLVRHDMRSPLAVLLGQCEILGMELGGALTEKQRRSVEAMERKAQQLKEMIDDLAAELGDVLGWESPRL